MTIFLMDMLNEVLLSIFSEWLEILDVGNLDSAVCNQTQRSSFLDLISDSFFIHNGSSSIDSKFLFSWIALRKMKVKNVHLRRCGEVTTAILSILKNSKNFDKLAFNFNLAVALAGQYIEIQTTSLELTAFGNETVKLLDRDFELLLSKISGIQTLKITACFSLTDQAFHCIIQYCPMLKNISVVLEEGSFSAYGFYILCNGCKYLTSITIEGLVDDTALEYIAQYALHVTHLTLDYIAYVEDSECRLVRVAEHGYIEYLDLTNGNDNSLLDTIRRSPRLTFLSVADDTRMTDEIMTALANNCPLLTYLSTSSFYNPNTYTDVGVCAVATKMSSTKSLKALGCAFHD